MHAHNHTHVHGHDAYSATTPSLLRMSIGARAAIAFTLTLLIWAAVYAVGAI